jgi:hypothetical protein
VAKLPVNVRDWLNGSFGGALTLGVALTLHAFIGVFAA